MDTIKILIILSLLYANAAFTAPFNSCPSEAFLVQSEPARFYGVNLATGFYEELSSNMGTSGKINAIGFNFHDDYIYGWHYESGSLAKIGDDYIAEPLTITNLPDANFYIGDVSLASNSYYMYRRGRTYGLYRIDLDESSVDYLNVVRIVDGASLNVNIYDFAFHPDTGFLYTVDSIGRLLKINAATGALDVLNNVGQSGTFGAVYFDSDGRFYISRNTDGHIFRIDLADPSPSAEFFAFGPSSSNNDGARCALADIINEESTVDFGDAPDSYGTSLDNNGARHEINEAIYLGDNVGGDDDGVDFVTGFESGLDTLIQVNAQGQGYLNSWVDWDQDGTFDNTEQVITDQQMSDGNNRVLIDVPPEAQEGDTWVRFRYSSQQSIGATGGVADGEVEDHEINVSQSGITVISYPSANSFVTLAYEDNWPVQGDYDMNDVVMAFQTHKYVDENQQVVRYVVNGELLAVGASYHNGFAIQLDNVPTSNINESLIGFELNGQAQSRSPLENNASNDDAVFIVSEDLWDHVSASPGCSYYRTEQGCNTEQNFSFNISIPLISGIASASAPANVLNPFIFATPAHYHGDGLGIHPGRSLEVHLKNKQVSAKFNTSFFGLMSDSSSHESGFTFLTSSGMPWALELPITWDHPRENVDILDAYPEFPLFVLSAGGTHETWYLREKATDNKVIQND